MKESEVRASVHFNKDFESHKAVKLKIIKR